VVFINNVKVFAYIQSWIGSVNVERIVLKTEKQFKNYGQPYKIINTTDNVYDKENWINLGNKWGYMSFYTALKDFDMSYDYMLYMSGDLDGAKIGWDKILDRSYEILNKYDIWNYSFEKTTQGLPIAYLKPLDNEENLFYSATNDLTIGWYHRDLVKTLLDFFEYFEKESDLLHEIPNTGWGIEMSLSSWSMLNKKAVVKDNKYIIPKRSTTSLYIQDLALRQERDYLAVFNKYNMRNNIDSNAQYLKQIAFIKSKTVNSKGKPLKMEYRGVDTIKLMYGVETLDIVKK
jgi:hypothetical protein